MINHNGIYSPQYNEKASAPYIGDVVSPQQAENAVSFAQAIMLFDELADREDISFGYTKDGCPARAHIMCLEIKEKGLAPKKAWAFSGRDNLLKVEMPDGAAMTWGCHVAAALPVRMPDGAVKNLVFDPGLFDGPVTAQEWGKLIGAKPENVQISDFGVPPKGHAGDYDPTYPEKDPDRLAKERMTADLKIQSREPRVVFQTSARQQFAPRQQGKTWVSVAGQQVQPLTMTSAQTVKIM